MQSPVLNLAVPSLAAPGRWCGHEMAPGASGAAAGANRCSLKIRCRKIKDTLSQTPNTRDQGPDLKDRCDSVPWFDTVPGCSRAACSWRLGHHGGTWAWPPQPRSRCCPGLSALGPPALHLPGLPLRLCKSCLKETSFSPIKTTNNEVVIAFYNAWTAG